MKYKIVRRMNVAAWRGNLHYAEAEELELSAATNREG
jgi:hypothetical protein